MEKTDKILLTNNLASVLEVCQEALIHKDMVGLVGDPGYGKTIGFEVARDKLGANAYLVTAQKSLNSKEFFSSIYNEISSENPNSTYTISYLIRKTANKFNETSLNKLLIIDEAGMFNQGMLDHLHEFRDLTQKTTGIILGGPMYFGTRLKKWSESNKPGIPELYDRINYWVELEVPTTDEKIAIAKENGIHDNAFFRHLEDECHNFRTATNAIKRYIQKKEMEEFEKNENSKSKKSKNKQS